MLMHDDKKAVTAIMTKRRNGDGVMVTSPMKIETVQDEGGELNALHLACQDILQALHEHSAEGLSQGLQNFLEIFHTLKDQASEQEV